jgi:hypothetical protein
MFFIKLTDPYHSLKWCLGVLQYPQWGYCLPLSFQMAVAPNRHFFKRVDGQKTLVLFEMVATV